MDIKEILVLHHSHLDVGYTHTQPIVWELQREFIDHALELLDETKDWGNYAAPKWTIEVTAQVMKWLETAGEEKINKLKSYIVKKRIGISGFEFNTTPLCSAEQLIKHVEKVKRLGEIFDVEIKTVNQHDVNGIPWSAVDILLDAGIELLIMAVNIHLGGPIEKRPSVFRWKGPSGREIFVMNGAHYTMFDQLLYTWENSIDRMKEGLDKYLEHLRSMNYKHDFIYLTTAAAPVCWDNSPPSIDAAKLIGEWNDRGLEPVIRYITPNELLEKIKSCPVDEYEIRTGDWTDYWNFGCASTAEVTKINTAAKQKLFKADMLNAFSGIVKKYYFDLAEKTWRHINLFDEHTWGSFNSMDADNIFSKTQFNIKDNDAFVANETAEYLLVDQLEEFTGNPKSAESQQGIAVINMSGMPKKEFVRIPDWWKLDGKRLRTSRFGWDTRYNQTANAPLCGPVEVDPYSYKFIRFNELPEGVPIDSLQDGEISSEKSARRLNTLEKTQEVTATKFIESDFYRIEFNPDNCRIVRVFDKINKRELLDAKSDYTFFQFVRERTDPLFKEERRAYYARELEKEQYDISCWNTEWEKIIETASRPLGYEIEKTAEGISLTLSFEAPGVKSFKQKILLHAFKPLISLKTSFYKEEIRTPESIYFVFPLKLEKKWECNFDTAGIPTELDTEQLSGASRDWFTVESYASLYNDNYGAVLFCPDAPMIQAGDFNFGKRSKRIERNENPLLLAWAMNNYWDTNFRPAQPGFIELEYHLTTFHEFNSASIKKEADSMKVKTEVHPAISIPASRQGKFFELDNDSVHVLHVKKSVVDEAVIFRLINYSEKNITAALSLYNKNFIKAEKIDVLEEPQNELSIVNNKVKLNLASRKIESIKLYYS
ncbi:MAG: hypothetical protein HYS25_12065 [Ignavibacteriales bacterium]|nr:hypothetical protein [Ignavibacteriales bacterium]